MHEPFWSWHGLNGAVIAGRMEGIASSAGKSGSGGSSGGGGRAAHLHLKQIASLQSRARKCGQSSLSSAEQGGMGTHEGPDFRCLSFRCHYRRSQVRSRDANPKPQQLPLEPAHTAESAGHAPEQACSCNCNCAIGS